MNPNSSQQPAARVRYKDRISYSHQLCQVDLTKVQTGSPMAPPTHELEVEIRNAKQLLEEAAKDQRGEENRYLEMVQVLLNNIRAFRVSRGFRKDARPLNWTLVFDDVHAQVCLFATLRRRRFC